MTIAFDHRHPGTAERDWAEAAPWQSSPAFDLDCDRLVVVAAHPDDETLGAAGLIATARSRGIPVSVLVLTDGHASGGNGASASDIARTRRRETVDAIAELGDGIGLVFAGMRDGGLREHEDEVRAAIVAAVSTAAGTRTLLVTPWHGDGHRDHRIVGSVAARLGGAGIRVVQYPIWMWHWATSDDVDTATWRALTLDDRAHAAKVRAVARHRSRLTATSPDEPPMLHAGMRSHFERHVEVYIDDIGRADDASVDPSWFRAFYERHDDPWGFESRWYERRKRELIVASLPGQRYEHVLELGCATGLLTEQLAARSGRITAVDVVDTALAKAHARVPHARVLQQRAPGEWPDGRFDLIVVSELAYYWSAAELAEALRRIRGSLAPGGELVVCHHRPRIDGRALDGDDVHAAIRASGFFRSVVTHAEEPFLLEVFRVDDGESR